MDKILLVDMNNIKECPFCHKKEFIVETLPLGTKDNNGEDLFNLHIKCTYCDTTGPRITCTEEKVPNNIKVAIEYWNKR